MGLIEVPNREVPVPRVLPGDRKIQSALAEVRGILDGVEEQLRLVRKARFEVDPPDNDAVRECVQKLLETPDRLRIVLQDLKTFTDTVPEDHAARMRAERQIAELRDQSEQARDP
jgi:hypothetical protein